MKTTQPIQSLNRGLILLETVANARQPVSLSQLALVLKIDRSSVFRLANTLKLRGFLAQLPDNKHYMLGSAVWQMAGLFNFGNVLLQLARDHVNALAADTGETIHLAIREGCRAILIDRQLTAKAIGVAGGGSGTHVPLYCTSVGKALLADFDYDRLIQLFGDKQLAKFTKRTITTLAKLAKECQNTCRRGYAVDNEEEHDGVRCIGAPIRDANGEIVASVGISAPVARLPQAFIKKTGTKVVATAVAISRALGHAAEKNEGKTKWRTIQVD